MEEEEQKIVKIVQDKYAEIATKQSSNELFGGCCGQKGQCCSGIASSLVKQTFGDSYEKIEGYMKEADLGLGCGVPTEFACIKEGDTVVDLGSGSGNDCFIARAKCGATGHVIGIDMTPEMIRLAQQNMDKTNFNNIEFRQGMIDNIPVMSNKVDVVISNCVINLAPDKNKVYKEIKRILKEGGHFSISDIVVTEILPKKIKEAAVMIAGCVAGALKQEQYLANIYNYFDEVDIKSQKEIKLPNELLKSIGMTDEEITDYEKSGIKILSQTILAVKGKEDVSCCQQKQQCCEQEKQQCCEQEKQQCCSQEKQQCCSQEKQQCCSQEKQQCCQQEGCCQKESCNKQ